MLVEMVAVIGASMAVMAVAVGLVHSAFDLERSARGQLAARQAVDRLAEQFRRDVHAAAQASVEADPPGCVLGGPGRPAITYRVEQGRLMREALDDDGTSPVASPVAFPLPRDGTAAFELREEAGRTLVALVLRPEAGSGAPAGSDPRSVRVEALLDRHSIRPPANGAAAQLPGETP